MHLPRKVSAAALAAGLVLGTAQAGWAAPGGAAPQKRSFTVTLVTGDQVTVASADATTAAVRPAKGRAGVRFAVSRHRGALYVIPQDAQRLVQTGKLDRRLFDVTGLVKSGYHDAARDTLPLIVTYGAGAARSALSSAGADVTRELSAVDGAAVSAPKDKTTQLWSAVTARGVDKVWLDGQRRISLDQSVPQIGAPAAWQAGYTGQGVTVAVLDTGVDAQHADLAGKVAESRNFTEVPEEGDTVGHGTHVASTIAGSGAASEGRYQGVAPDATLLSGKVCESVFCTESAILAGMQWAAAEKHATAVNLSLGGFDTPEIDPLEEAVNTLTAEHGTLFVIAAGNDGSDGSVSSPGSADAALTVGAVDKSDELAVFSSRGPRVGDDAVKPDITAPGVDIVAARASGTTLDQPVDEHYVRASGTSMATPHVVGSVALLAQQHPDWTAGRLKATLMAAAKPNPALTAYQQGAGRADVARAITQTVTTDPVGLSYGRPFWPHDDDEPVAKTVTYRNGGTADVTLDLDIRVLGPEGAAPPAGMFQPSAEQVTVPAGGAAQVTVTADTRVGGPDGLYSGQLMAAGGDTVVATPLGVHKEVESYNLTLAHVDAAGAAAADYFTLLVGLDTNFFAVPYEEDGTVTLRAPKGQYDVATIVGTPRGEEDVDLAFLVQPLINLTEDTTVTLDARLGKPVSTTVPERSARVAVVDVSFGHFTPTGGGLGFGLGTDTFDGLTTAHLGPALPPSEFVSAIASQWAKPDAEGSFADSPYLYSVAETVAGQLPTGYSKDYRARDLATVRQEFGVPDAGMLGERFAFPVYEQGLGGSAIVLPANGGSRVEYYSAKGVQWTSEVWLGTPTQEGFLDVKSYLFQPATTYRAGKQYRDRWTTGPFGPVFPAPLWEGSWISRQGDTILVDVPFYGDRAGHGGFSMTDTARTALYRNGELVGETDISALGQFEVPAERASYRLEAADTRSVGELTSQVSAVWTFRSGHVDGEEFAKLPVSVVRFSPTLDANNAAPAGVTFDIPVRVQRQPGAPAAKVKRLTVEVSYDDGKTWRAAALRKSGDGWVASVRHPSGAGFASLRAKATDSGGNTVTQTIVHAYRLG